MTNFFSNFKYNKFSQIFLLDFIFATVLIVVSVGTFFVYYSITDPQEDLFDITYRLSNTMSSTYINELNNDFVRSLFISREITNIENTILQQISEFYEKGEFNLADNLMSNVVDTYLIDRVGYEIELLDVGDSTTRVLDSSGNYLDKNDSKTIASIQRQIIGFEGDNPFIHRYTFEVWRN